MVSQHASRPTQVTIYNTLFHSPVSAPMLCKEKQTTRLATVQAFFVCQREAPTSRTATGSHAVPATPAVKNMLHIFGVLGFVHLNIAVLQCSQDLALALE